MQFDPDGRAWVVELRSYMPNADGIGEDAPTGRISILDDTDGDGLFDKKTVFLDRLVLPRALLLVKGGVWCANHPRFGFIRTPTTGPGRARWWPETLRRKATRSADAS